MDNLNNVADSPTVEVFATKASEKRKEVKLVVRGMLRADLVRNPRIPTVYDDERNQKLARNIYDYGLQKDLVVSLRADGLYWILQGHRRFAAINTVATKGVDAVKGDSSKPALPADPDRFVKVQCLVYKGLSLEEEMDLVMDHGDVILLNEQEKFLAARNMASVGFTHQLIADKLGMSRPNYTNGIGKLMQLPDCVIETFLSTDKDAIALTQNARKELFEAYQKDQKAPGARIKVGGEGFNAVWERIQKEGAAPPIKVLSKEKLTALCSALSPNTDADLLDLIQSIRDGNQQNAAAAINRLRTLTTLAGDTVGTGFVRVEEGVATTVGDYSSVE